MAMSVDLGLSSRAVEKQLSKLKDMGVIERIGPAKGGFWKINLED
jgi:ATP-dependent DNA helicase RecG